MVKCVPHRFTATDQTEPQYIKTYSQYFTQDTKLGDVMMVVLFQNEAFNSALVLEIKRLSQLSLFFSKA